MTLKVDVLTKSESKAAPGLCPAHNQHVPEQLPQAVEHFAQSRLFGAPWTNDERKKKYGKSVKMP